MFVVLGLIILVAAVVAGVAGVFNNVGSGHALTGFSVFGYHMTFHRAPLRRGGRHAGLGLLLLRAGPHTQPRRTAN